MSHQAMALRLPWFLGLLSVVRGSLEDAYANCQVISVAQDLRLYWTVDETAGRINLGVSANLFQDGNTRASVYMAWTPSQNLFKDKKHPTDVSLLMDSWIISTGAPAAGDECADGCVLDTWLRQNTPEEEDTPHMTDVLVSQVDGFLEAQWSRLLITDDPFDYDIALNETMHLQWSAIEQAVGGIAGSLMFPKHPIDLTGATPVHFGETRSCEEEQQTNTYQSPGKEFSLNWKIEADSIKFEMVGQTTGWISVGFSTSPLMADCDMYTGWVGESGDVLLFDNWSPDSVNRPLADVEELGGVENTEAVEGTEVDGVTTISFTRLLRTGDGEGHDQDIINDDLYLIWAVHSQDGVSPVDYEIHDIYGVGLVNFFTGESSLVDTALDPGWVLSVVMLSLVSLFSLCSLVFKACRQFRSVGLSEADQKEVADFVGSDEPLPSLMLNESWAEQQSDEPRVRRLPSLRLSGSFYHSGRGSTTESVEMQAVSSPTNPDHDDRQHLHAAATGTRPRGCLSARVPFMEATVLQVGLFGCFVVINIGCMFFGTQPIPSKLGFLTAANMFFVSVPATRNSVLVWLLDLPFEQVIFFHRWMGRWTVLLSLVHMLWYYLYWLMSPLGTIDYIVTQQFEVDRNIFGFLAFLSTHLIFWSSLAWIRRNRFEWFYYLHFAFILVFIFGALHTPHFQPYLIAASLLYGIDRGLRLVWGTCPTRTTLVKIKPSNLLQIHLPKNNLAKCMGMYQVGQYYFINFPKLNLLEWHPFSISSSPRDLNLEIHIRALGNHTSKLLERAALHDTLWARVDGPYGNSSNLKRQPIQVFVAGGVGVTPIMGMLKDIYSIGNIDPALAPSTPPAVVYFVWCMRTDQEFLWFDQDIYECIARGKSGVFPPVFPYLHLTQVEKASLPLKPGCPNPNLFQYGRPDICSILQKVHELNPGQATSVFACGPNSLVRATWAATQKSRKQHHKVDFHHETFEF